MLKSVQLTPYYNKRLHIHINLSHPTLPCCSSAQTSKVPLHCPKCHHKGEQHTLAAEQDKAPLTSLSSGL